MDLAQEFRNLIPSWVAQYESLANPRIVTAVLCAAVMFLWQLRSFFAERKSSGPLTLEAPGFPAIEALQNFDWKTTEPLKCRPFKPKYHLTMALESLEPSELILMDKTYKDRIALRTSLLQKHHDTVVAVRDDRPRIRAAVDELYTFIMGTYLPGRYPTMFTFHQTVFESGKAAMLENKVTGEIWPAQLSAGAPTIRALETLAKVVDEEFLILLPQEGHPQGREKDPLGETATSTPQYILEAYETCFPSGFDTRQKLGLRLADIHGPVPHYGEKIERSMDRFFANLEVGKYVKRVNWSITTDAELFAAFGGVHSQEGETMKPLTVRELDLENTRLRCERQTLHRLPKSKAIVFAFHTYLYTLQEVKAEGLGNELAQAIDGLKEGSSPRIHHYKRGPVWGEAVKAFLTS